MGSLPFFCSFLNVINRLQLAEKCNLHYKPFLAQIWSQFFSCATGFANSHLKFQSKGGAAAGAGKGGSPRACPPPPWSLLGSSGSQCHCPGATYLGCLDCPGICTLSGWFGICSVTLNSFAFHFTPWSQVNQDFHLQYFDKRWSSYQGTWAPQAELQRTSAMRSRVHRFPRGEHLLWAFGDA